MENSEGALIIHDAMYVGPDGQALGPWTCPFSEGVVPPNQFIERLLIQNFIAIPSPVFRRNAAVQSGGLNEALWFSADWDLWLRLGSDGPGTLHSRNLKCLPRPPRVTDSGTQSTTHEWEKQLTTVLANHPGRLADQRANSVDRWSALPWCRSWSIPPYPRLLAANP